MPNTIPSNTDSVIDSRDIIERIDELQAERDRWIGERTEAETWSPEWRAAVEEWAAAYPEEGAEFAALDALASEASGYADDWSYGVTLIRDDYFTDYARELLEDCGTIPRDLPAWVEIDWEATARNVRADYTGVEFDGVTYWVR